MYEGLFGEGLAMFTVQLLQPDARAGKQKILNNFCLHVRWRLHFEALTIQIDTCS